MDTSNGYNHDTNAQKGLASWLDQPYFPWKKLVIGFSLGEFAFENWLLYRQYKVLRRTVRPKALHSEIEQETFDKSQVLLSHTPLARLSAHRVL